MKHKNDYSVIVFNNQKSANPWAKKWLYVHNLFNFSTFLNKQFPEWYYMNVYDRRTGVYYNRFYKGNFIPPFIPEQKSK